MHTGIPILMYHSLAGTGSSGPRNVSVTPGDFARQMEWLHNQGYTTVTDAQLANYQAAGAVPTGKLICLTFDDGYRSWLTQAAPVLAGYGFNAVMFLSTRYIGGVYKRSDIELDIDDQPLQWSEITELVANGWEPQVHGCVHARWTHMAPDHLVAELTNCRSEIQQRLGSVAQSVAYPFGSYNKIVLQYVSQLGFRSGFSVHTGRFFPDADPLRLPRIEVNSHDTLETFARKVTTGFTSPTQAIKASLRDLLYANRWLKDVLSGNE